MQAPDATAPPLPANWLEIVAAVAVVATLAIGAAIIVSTLVRRVLVSFLGDDSPRDQALANGAARLVRLVTFFALAGILTMPALDIAGVKVPPGFRSQQLWEWLARSGVRIVVVMVLASVLVRLTTAVAARAEQDLGTGTGIAGTERRKRAQTIGSLVRRSLSFLIWTMALLIVLRQLDVDITPVLTGAGIVGLAFGFGAQTLVRDVISGFFIIVEDQVRVGDVAEVNGKGGLVEQINLRTIVLRDSEGAVLVVPNGEIKTLLNRSKDFSYYVIDLPIAYEDNADEVMTEVSSAAAEMAREPQWAAAILEPLEMWGVDAFGDSQVTLKFRIKTVPLKQWEVGRELRRRLKTRLGTRGLQPPYPQIRVHLPEELQAALEARHTERQPPSAPPSAPR